MCRLTFFFLVGEKVRTNIRSSKNKQQQLLEVTLTLQQSLITNWLSYKTDRNTTNITETTHVVKRLIFSIPRPMKSGTILGPEGKLISGKKRHKLLKCNLFFPCCTNNNNNKPIPLDPRPSTLLMIASSFLIESFYFLSKILNTRIATDSALDLNSHSRSVVCILHSV